jgi:hypothetical protein
LATSQREEYNFSKNLLCIGNMQEIIFKICQSQPFSLKSSEYEEFFPIKSFAKFIPPFGSQNDKTLPPKNAKYGT